MTETFCFVRNLSMVIKRAKARYIPIFLTIALIFTGCASLSSGSKAKSGNIENAPEIITALSGAVDQSFKDVNRGSKIAVVHIQTPNNALNDFLLSELQHILVNRTYNVVERIDLDKIRTERDFQYSNEVDDNTAVSVGKFVGADLVVTGGIDGEGSYRRMRLKVLDTQTAIIRGTASVQIEKPPKTPLFSSIDFSFEVIAGGGLNTITGYGEKEGDFNGGSGYTLGGSLDIKHKKYPIVLEPGIRFLNKGAKYEEHDNQGKIATLEESFNFVNIFAKAKWNIPIASSVTAQPFAGYAIEKLLSADETFKYEGVKNEFDITKHCYKQGHAILAGADVIIKDSYIIGGEYGHSFTDIYKDNRYKYSMDTFLLYIGYKF